MNSLDFGPQALFAEHLEKSITQFAAQLRDSVTEYYETAQLLASLHLFPREATTSSIQPKYDQARLQQKAEAVYRDSQPSPQPQLEPVQESRRERRLLRKEPLRRPPLQNSLQGPALWHSESERGHDSPQHPFQRTSGQQYLLPTVLFLSFVVVHLHKRLRSLPKHGEPNRRTKRLRKRTRNATSTKCIPLRTFLRQYQPYCVPRYVDTDSDAVGDLNDNLRYPPLPTLKMKNPSKQRSVCRRASRPRKLICHQRSTIQPSLDTQAFSPEEGGQCAAQPTPEADFSDSTLAVPEMRLEPVSSSSAIVQNQTTTVLPLVWYGLRPGVEVVRRQDDFGRLRDDWRCTCGYLNWQSRVECRTCSKPKLRPTHLPPTSSPSPSKGNCLIQ